MEELSPGNAGVDEIETASITSTIETEIDSDGEWTVSSVLAEHEDGGKLYYLIRWEGYELFDASWEPEENLSATLLTHWQETRKQDDHERKTNLNIGAWRRASIERFRSKLARHEERNRKRLERGLEPTVYPTTLEEHIEALNLWPEGEEPDDPTTPSSPERKADDKTDDQPFPSSPEMDQTATATVTAKVTATATATATVTASQSDEDDEEDFPRHSRRKRVAPAQENSRERVEPAPSSAASKEVPRRTSGDGVKRPDGPRRQVVPQSNGLLTSKFSRPNPPRRTSSEANTKEIAVRKAQAPDAFTGNVFAGGKVRKQRSTLVEAVDDPTRQPKILRHRLTRIVEKRRRDRDGAVAPSKKPAVLFSLNPAENRESAQNPSANVSSPEAVEVEEANSLVRDADRVQQEGNSPTSDREPPKPKKKKKSISWGQVEEATIPPIEELMDTGEDESLFVLGHSVTSRVTNIDGPKTSSAMVPAVPPNPSARRVRWAGEPPIVNGNANQAAYTITKDVQFGPGASTTISVTFKGPQPQLGQSWIFALEHEPKLVFTHSCMAKDFQACVASMSTSESVINGLVSGNDNLTSFASICNWLWVRSVAVLFQHAEFCVLLHAPEDGQVVGSDATVPELKYILFQPAPHFSTSLAPISIPGEVTSSGVLPRIGATVFYRVFKFHYERLLPENALNSPSKHHFFLAFPPSAALEAQFLGRWLRSCNPDCRIFTSVFPGQWHTFLKMEQGVVIVPEEAIWSARLFPNLHSLLHSSPSNFQFWLFSKSLQPSAMYPSADNASEIGDISVQPICANRKAILVTPSFMVSQPQQVWNFFKWFWKAWNRDNDAVRLVVCAGFDSWLHDLTLEKTDKLDKLSRNLQPPANSKEGIEALYKTWTMVLALLDATSEEQPALISAPESIDGNDEQSLVNWFGWWSIMNMDRFRKFTVLGSSEPDSQRLSRHIKRPRYLASTCANPDDAYLTLDRTDTSKPLPPTQPAAEQLRAQLQLVPGDDAHSFKTFLSRIDDKAKDSAWSPHTVYRFPVSYWDPAMAYDFADYHSAFESYGQCLRFIRDYVLESAHQFHNTAMALFYTMEGTWDANRDPKAIGKTRRPWIMVYRPVEPHRKPWKNAELLIWDPLRKGHLGEHERGKVYEGDLIQAQRELIRAVQMELSPTLPLEKVWIAGLDGKPPNLTEPVDLTLHQLQMFMENLKACIPAPHKKLPLRGWKSVHAGDAPVSARLSSPEPMDIDGRGELDGEDLEARLKTVFHPPRGKQMNRSSNCKNRLYQHSLREAERGNKRESMEFRFRPTMEWYRQQVEEGRGFEQLQVTPWEAVFEKYKIDDPKRD